MNSWIASLIGSSTKCREFRAWSTIYRGSRLRRSSGSDRPFAIYRYRSPSIARNWKRSIGIVRHLSKRSSYPSKRPFTIDSRLSRTTRLLEQLHHDAAKSTRLLQLQPRLERPAPAQLKIRRWRSSDLGLLLELFPCVQPCINLIGIPNNAARGQIETFWKIFPLLHFVDGCVRQRDNLAQFG